MKLVEPWQWITARTSSAPGLLEHRAHRRRDGRSTAAWSSVHGGAGRRSTRASSPATRPSPRRRARRPACAPTARGRCWPDAGAVDEQHRALASGSCAPADVDQVQRHAVAAVKGTTLGERFSPPRVDVPESPANSAPKRASASSARPDGRGRSSAAARSPAGGCAGCRPRSPRLSAVVGLDVAGEDPREQRRCVAPHVEPGPSSTSLKPTSVSGWPSPSLNSSR